jgi:hypothetical protein
LTLRSLRGAPVVRVATTLVLAPQIKLVSARRYRDASAAEAKRKHTSDCPVSDGARLWVAGSTCRSSWGCAMAVICARERPSDAQTFESDGSVGEGRPHVSAKDALGYRRLARVDLGARPSGPPSGNASTPAPG